MTRSSKPATSQGKGKLPSAEALRRGGYSEEQIAQLSAKGPLREAAPDAAMRPRPEDVTAAAAKNRIEQFHALLHKVSDRGYEYFGALRQSWIEARDAAEQAGEEFRDDDPEVASASFRQMLSSALNLYSDEDKVRFLVTRRGDWYKQPPPSPGATSVNFIAALRNSGLKDDNDLVTSTDEAVRVWGVMNPLWETLAQEEQNKLEAQRQAERQRQDSLETEKRFIATKREDLKVLRAFIDEEIKRHEDVVSSWCNEFKEWRDKWNKAATPLHNLRPPHAPITDAVAPLCDASLDAPPKLDTKVMKAIMNVLTPILGTEPQLMGSRLLELATEGSDWDFYVPRDKQPKGDLTTLGGFEWKVVLRDNHFIACIKTTISLTLDDTTITTVDVNVSFMKSAYDHSDRVLSTLQAAPPAIRALLFTARRLLRDASVDDSGVKAKMLVDRVVVGTVSWAKTCAFALNRWHAYAVLWMAFRQLSDECIRALVVVNGRSVNDVKLRISTALGEQVDVSFTRCRAMIHALLRAARPLCGTGVAYSQKPIVMSSARYQLLVDYTQRISEFLLGFGTSNLYGTHEPVSATWSTSNEATPYRIAEGFSLWNNDSSDAVCVGQLGVHPIKCCHKLRSQHPEALVDCCAVDAHVSDLVLQGYACVAAGTPFPSR